MAHQHYREKCIFCKKLTGNYCRCPGTTINDLGMHTKWSVCEKCYGKSIPADYIYHKDSGTYSIDPMTPLKTKEFMFSALDFFYYWIDQYEIAAKYTGEFTEAGNFMRYPGFIPKNETWIDIALPWNEVVLALAHESLEARSMQFGLSYDPAHLQAQKIEDYCRQNIAGKTGTDENYVDSLLSDGGIG